MRGLRTYFVRELAEDGIRSVVHGPQGEEAAPQIVSAAFVGVRSEVLLHTLEDKRYLRVRRKCLLYAQTEAEVAYTEGHSDCRRIRWKQPFGSASVRHTTREELDYTLQALR